MVETNPDIGAFFTPLHRGPSSLVVRAADIGLRKSCV